MEAPTTIREDVEHRSMDGGDMVLRTVYEEPGAGREDLYKEYDIWAARRMYSLLLAAYPGYPWACQHDSTNKIAKIGIPILTGVRDWYVINLVQTPLTPGAVVVGGGEILERYQQSRTRFNLGAFLAAREIHSKLVDSRRAIPV